jgi:hypothetical protein
MLIRISDDAVVVIKELPSRGAVQVDSSDENMVR